MSNVYLRCKNKACLLHNNPIVWTEGTPSIPCPLCQSQMEIDEDSDWLFRMAEDEKYWISDAETVYPSILAYEYRNLRWFCRKGDLSHV